MTRVADMMAGEASDNTSVSESEVKEVVTKSVKSKSTKAVKSAAVAKVDRVAKAKSRGSESTSVSRTRSRSKHHQRKASKGRRSEKARERRASPSLGKAPRRRQPSRSASTKPMRQPRREKKEHKEPSVEKESKQNERVSKDSGSTVKNEVKKEMKKNHLKKMNFRDFMMHHCEDSASPEDAILAYKAYGQELAKKELDILKPTGLFFDLYHPMAQLRLYDWQRQMAQMRARIFVEDLKADKYKGLCLRARRPVGLPGASASPTCPVTGHLQAPEFAFDANVGTLMISGLPVAVSTWDSWFCFTTLKIP